MVVVVVARKVPREKRKREREDRVALCCLHTVVCLHNQLLNSQWRTRARVAPHPRTTLLRSKKRSLFGRRDTLALHTGSAWSILLGSGRVHRKTSSAPHAPLPRCTSPNTIGRWAEAQCTLEALGSFITSTLRSSLCSSPVNNLNCGMHSHDSIYTLQYHPSALLRASM